MAAFSIGTAAAGEWPVVGRVLFATAADPGPVTARFLELIASRDIDPAGLFVARDHAGPCGVILAQRFAGRQGAVWPPAVPAGSGQGAVEDALTAFALGWLRDGNAKVVQAVVRAGESGIPALERAGVGRVTELSFLSRDIVPADADRPDPVLRGVTIPGPPVTIEPYSSATAAAVADVLIASYDGTLDCPELNDIRTAEEILAGYRDASGSGTREWYLAARGSKPVGVLLLSAPGPATWGLTYLGLIPAARGVGFGRALTRFAVRRAATGGATDLTLNVDVRNVPALRLYATEGFEEFDRREVYLAIWHK
jgi:ribosomal protein S18 acetylase RimI-like enzyme